MFIPSVSLTADSSPCNKGSLVRTIPITKTQAGYALRTPPGIIYRRSGREDHFFRYSSAMRLMADTPEIMTFSSKTILPLCSDT